MSPFFECWIVIAIVIILMVFVGAPVGRRAKQWMSDFHDYKDCILDDILTGILAIVVIVIAAVLLAVVSTTLLFGIISGIEQIIELSQ